MVTTRFLTILALLSAGVATACGNSTVTTDGGDADTTPVDAECPAPMALSGLDDVRPLLGDSSDWVAVGPYGWDAIPVITPDLQATTDLLLDATTIPGPDWCAASGCRTEVRFLVVGAIDGVSVEGVVDDDLRMLGDRPFLRVRAGAAFRLRPVVRDTHISTYNWIPILEVHPPCTTSCAAETRLCLSDLVCYRAGENYCLYCETRPAPECGCVGVPAGGDCWYALSGDNVVVGLCSDGICVRE